LFNVHPYQITRYMLSYDIDDFAALTKFKTGHIIFVKKDVAKN